MEPSAKAGLASIRRWHPYRWQKQKKRDEFAKKAGYPAIANWGNPTREIYEIYTESKRFGFPTVIDNFFYTKSIPEIFSAKEQAQIPLLLGWNSAEIPGQHLCRGNPIRKKIMLTK